MGQKDFTPPTIQLCSHLFLLCHQKTIFWRLLLLTTHLSSSNYSIVGQPSIKEVFLQRRRRHKQIIRQSTVQCPGSNGSKTSRNILGRGQGSVWSRKETLCCISVWAPRVRRLEVVTTFSTSLISTGVPLCPLILGYCFMPSFIYEGSPLSQLSTVYTAIAPLYTEQESLARSAVKWSVWVWIIIIF